MKQLRNFLILFAILLALPLTAHGDAVSGRACQRKYTGISSDWLLFDGLEDAYIYVNPNAALHLTAPEEIGSLYFIFYEPHGVYRVTDNETDVTHEFGQEEFLHDFVDLQNAFGKGLRDFTITFPQETRLLELYLYTPGEVPDSVQKWNICPEGGADLMLVSAHGDDEQLFFAGVLPYYAGELQYRVQVVYLTNHFNTAPLRVHEMLNGLWSCGVRDYPVFAPFRDLHSRALDNAYTQMRQFDVSREDLLEYFTAQVRKYRPQVLVTHDVNGEYGHGQHRMLADLFMEIAQTSGDPQIFSESAEAYGPWDIPKTYLHLYEENPIVMNWDIPLEAFDGMTAYEVTRDLGFPCHESQVSDFNWYFRNAPKATDVQRYSPCYYGLYRTTVGPDTGKADFFENVMTHTQQTQYEARQQAQAEALEKEAREKQAQEEAARLAAATQPAVVPTQPPATQPDAVGTSAPSLGFLLWGIPLFLLVGGLLLYYFIRKKKTEDF